MHIGPCFVKGWEIVEVLDKVRQSCLLGLWVGILTWARLSAFSTNRSVVQSCPTLCYPVDFSMPGFPVHHPLLEFIQLRTVTYIIFRKYFISNKWEYWSGEVPGFCKSKKKTRKGKKLRLDRKRHSSWASYFLRSWGCWSGHRRGGESSWLTGSAMAGPAFKGMSCWGLRNLTLPPGHHSFPIFFSKCVT